MTKLSNQSGFAAIEAVLIIIIVAIIGFTGWYVWHSSQKTNNTLANSNQQAQTPAAIKYLNIKEWGVRLAYQDTNTYSYKLNNGTVQVVSSLLSKKYECTTSGAGEIVRMQPTDAVSATDSTTVANAAKQHPGTYGHVGNYYYAFQHDQAACSSRVTTAAQNQANNFVQALVPKMQAIPKA